MKYWIVHIIIVGMLSNYLNSQQLPSGPASMSYDLIWNPAGTGSINQLSFGVNYRKKWLSFEGAPRTSTIYFEKPFWSSNMSVGAFFQSDKNGPISLNYMGLNYAYQLRWDDHQLSLGTAITFKQLSINNSNLRVLDPDPVLSRLETGIHPDANIGVHFSTNIEDFEDEGSFFLGSYVNSLRDLIITNKISEPNFKPDASWHGGLYGGAAMVKESLTWRPQFWIDYHSNSPVRYIVGISMKYRNNITIGTYYSNDAQAYLKVEVDLENQMFRDGTLRLYMFPNYNFSSISDNLRYSLEVGIRYDFIQDW